MASPLSSTWVRAGARDGPGTLTLSVGPCLEDLRAFIDSVCGQVPGSARTAWAEAMWRVYRRRDSSRLALPWSVKPMALDLNPLFGPRRDDTVGTMARGLQGSEILRIAAEIRELVAQGKQVCNLTVGDF